mgnify:CR=1 FL=1|tara:strand:- start:685 stop:840 length:156 start_codon:yes stop_codon:yes gene_type:complete
MEKEIKYLSEKIDDLINIVQRDLDYGYSGSIIDEQLEEITILKNILDSLEG